MGRYLTAVLIYGYAVAEEESIWDEDDDDEDRVDEEWLVQLLKRRGIVDQVDYSNYPAQDYSRGKTYEEQRADWQTRYAAWKEEHKPQLEAWDEARNAAKAEFANIAIEYGGVEDYQQPVIGIKDSGFTAHDSVSQVDAESLRSLGGVSPATREWDEDLQRFCKEAGIDLTRKAWDDKPVFNGPAWWLVQSYG